MQKYVCLLFYFVLESGGGQGGAGARGKGSREWIDELGKATAWHGAS